jgi:hypothetical protein
MKKIIWIVGAVIIVAAVAVAGVIFRIYKFGWWGSGARYACTMEAKICPDGTAVGRSGPNCDFAPCPIITTTPTNASLQNISIKSGDTIKSPLQITGEAKGTWYFEASFPIKIYDANGVLLGSTPAQAQSDWMTENFVPFKVTLSFATSTTQTGTLVLEKDNPSGLLQNADRIEIPVRFKN